MSLELSVNPNTIQKAYGELDAKGIIGSVPGRGCYVMPGAANILASLARNRLTALCALAEELMACGVSKEDIIDAIEKTDIPKKEATK